MKLDESVDETGNLSIETKVKKNMSQTLRDQVEDELTNVCNEVLVC